MRATIGRIVERESSDAPRRADAARLTQIKAGEAVGCERVRAAIAA
ncbi:MAG TPA: hypothetical protein VHT04_05270 [Stellaceae bacterium]|jgi:hypothetical protein|nr:hypothetical protein [Stellaceae bacterium]